MKTALKYMINTGIAPEEALIRQDTFATDRTQERKRPSIAKIKPQVDTSDSD